METVSKKRGRPQVDDEYLKASGQIWHEIHTRRGLQDRKFAIRAVNVLAGGRGASKMPPEFRWLYDISNPARAIKWSILAQLGRIDDGETILRLATQLCTLKLSVKEAVVKIRLLRTGGSAAGGPRALAMEICRVIDNYRNRYPATTGSQIFNSLAIAANAVEETSSPA